MALRKRSSKMKTAVGILKASASGEIETAGALAIEKDMESVSISALLNNLTNAKINL